MTYEILPTFTPAAVLNISTHTLEQVLRKKGRVLTFGKEFG
jgi:hypothetical protein